jgi:hypothetical protein
VKLTRIARILAVAASAASCRQLLGLDSPSHGIGDANAPTIDVAIDAPTCTGASTSCFDQDTLLTCTTPGVVGTLTPCAWGCDSTNVVAACYEVAPAGGGVLASDVAPDQTLSPVTLSGGAIINSTLGTISLGGAAVTGYTQQLRNNVSVFRVASLTVKGSVLTTGQYPIALVANGDITIEGTIDGTGGCDLLQGGPGGGQGGNRNEDGGGSGGGQRGQMNDGGGGGGYGGDGGSGSGQGGTVGVGGSAFGEATISMLTGGGGGGAGQGSGGGGGGGIQLVSNGTITIEAAGAINAGGCGGASTGDPSGGGGGAGGTILLEAPTVTIDGALAVNGGGGAGGGPNSTSGSDATLDRTPATGGLGGAQGGSGGDGAAGATTDGATGNVKTYGGGGGGAVGRIRVNTRRGTGVTVDPSSVMSPAFSDTTTATQGSAAVQ